MTQFEQLSLVFSGLTTVSIVLAGWQLWEARKQHRSDFEDAFTERYRALLRELPRSALLRGEDEESVGPAHVMRHFNVYYRYLDLCNEQVFLRSVKRISKETWREWHPGIRGMVLRRPFQVALSLLPPGEFTELRLLVDADFNFDPIDLKKIRTQMKNQRLTSPSPGDHPGTRKPVQRT